MVFQKRSSTLTERAYEHLRAKLLSGELAPGTRLVNRAIAKEIGTSAIPVREAISRLISEGLVEYVPSAGAFVRARSPQELADMYDLAEAIEPVAAAKAAEHISERELEELQTIVDDWREMVRGLRHRPEGQLTAAQVVRWHENEIRFRQVVVDAARNGLMSKFARELAVVAQVFDSLRRPSEVITPAAAESMCRGYETLLAPLRARDPVRMREQMLAHVRRAREAALRRPPEAPARRPKKR
jgi:DNA-binding GntR family transcriptional regulator